MLYVIMCQEHNGVPIALGVYTSEDAVRKDFPTYKGGCCKFEQAGLNYWADMVDDNIRQ